MTFYKEQNIHHSELLSYEKNKSTHFASQRTSHSVFQRTAPSIRFCLNQLHRNKSHLLELSLSSTSSQVLSAENTFIPNGFSEINNKTEKSTALIKVSRLLLGNSASDET